MAKSAGMRRLTEVNLTGYLQAAAACMSDQSHEIHTVQILMYYYPDFRAGRSIIVAILLTLKPPSSGWRNWTHLDITQLRTHSYTRNRRTVVNEPRAEVEAGNGASYCVLY